jgi:hypothetical protein
MRSLLAVLFALEVSTPAAGQSSALWDAALAGACDAEEGGGAERLDAAVSLIEKAHAATSVDSSLQESLAAFTNGLGQFDIDAVHDSMPYRRPDSRWRAIGFSAHDEPQAYRLVAYRPDLEAWRKLPDGPSRVGDALLQARTRPLRDDLYQLDISGRLDLAGICPARMIADILRWPDWSQPGLPGAAAARSRRLETTFARDMPRTVGFLARYVDVKQLVGEQAMSLDLQLDVDAFRADFPALHALLEKARGMLRGRGAIFADDGQLAASYSVDLRDYSMTFEVVSAAGLLSSPRLTSRLNLVADMDGVTVEVVDLRHVLSRGDGPDGGLTLAMARPPAAVKMSGYALGFVPLWLLDALIPSDLETIAREFIAAMSKGPDGRGSRIELRRSGRAHVVQVDATLLANGLLAFAMRMKDALGVTSPEVVAETLRFEREVIEAMISDYRRLRLAHVAPISP